RTRRMVCFENVKSVDPRFLPITLVSVSSTGIRLSKERFLNARGIQIVGALFLTVLSVPSLCGQSSRSDPWLDFPSYDQTLVWYLRRGADAKEGKRRLAQDSASVDTFRRLVTAERHDDALLVL